MWGYIGLRLHHMTGQICDNWQHKFSEKVFYWIKNIIVNTTVLQNYWGTISFTNATISGGRTWWPWYFWLAQMAWAPDRPWWGWDKMCRPVCKSKKGFSPKGVLGWQSVTRGWIVSWVHHVRKKVDLQKKWKFQHSPKVPTWESASANQGDSYNGLCGS